MSETTRHNQDPKPAHAADTTSALGDQAPATVEPLGENQLALTKNGKRYVFECAPGTEAQTLNQIAEMVTRNESDLTWFDAAVLSHQLGERMSQRLSELGAKRRSA